MSSTTEHLRGIDGLPELPSGDAGPEARAATEAEPSGWRPIETAPKDGATILLFCPQGDGNPGSTYRVTAGSWCYDPGGTTEYRDAEGRWLDQDDRDGFEGWLSWDGGFSEDTMMPTHWQPLPEPPAPGGGGSRAVHEGKLRDEPSLLDDLARD